MMKPLIAFTVLLGAIAVGSTANTTQQPSREQLYLAETSRAMDKMMADMTVPATGDIDADFVSMMVPHHRGAIAMAQAELTYGRNELLRRIAHGIIVAQLQEIEAMHLALASPAAAYARSLDAKPAVIKGHHHAP